MSQTQVYVCSHAYDPCYGLPVLRPGDILFIQDDTPYQVRVIRDSRNGVSPGWGWPLSYHELRGHFRLWDGR